MRELERMCQKIKPIKPRKHRIRNFFKQHKGKFPYLLMGTGISLLLASGTGYLLHKNSESKDFAQKSSVASQYPDEKLRKMLAESVLEPAEEPALTEAEAKKLAKRIGFPSSRIDTDFLYAIKEIGPGPTERLYKDYGVTQFSRYSSYTYSKNHYGSGKRRVSEPLLNKIAANTGRQEHARPILLLAYPEYDWNQAFGEVYWSAINQMAEQYTILLIESKKEEEFYKRIRFVARTHGPITTMVLGGHGSPTGLWLEKGFAGKRTIDIWDSKEIRRLRDCFSPRPTIILESCSTGATKHGLAAVISRELKGTVFAPSKPASITDMHIDGSGKVSVKYEACDTHFEGMFLCGSEERKDVTRVFKNGKLISY